MTEPINLRCKNCGTEYTAGQSSCETCGGPLPKPGSGPPAWHGVVGSGLLGRAMGVPAYVPPPRDERPAPRSSSSHVLLKWALALWAIAYPIVSCSPMLIGTSSAGAAATTGFASIILGTALLVPWLIGIVILGVLVLVTK